MYYIVKPTSRLVGHPAYGKAELLVDDDGHFASFDTLDEAKAWLDAEGIDVDSVFIMKLVG